MSSLSNDLLADRRFAWAKALAAEGDAAAAADLLEQVIERVPDWAPGWAALAEAREGSGYRAGAIAAWSRAAALDPGGSLGAALHLLRLSELTPDAMADDYVRALFDHYAPRFERHLVEELAYRGPALLIAALDRVAPGRSYARVLDLGCGTGLMGRALAHRALRIDGVDLSSAMIEQARTSQVYADLRVSSLDVALATGDGDAYDLVTAADVLVYIGDLAPFVAGVHRQLRSGGLLAFTAQSFVDEATRPTRFALGRDLRFRHSADYVAAALWSAGFRPTMMDEASARSEKSVPVPGLVVVASKR